MKIRDYSQMDVPKDSFWESSKGVLLDIPSEGGYPILENDSNKINEFEKKYNITFPKEGKLIIAEDNNGQIKAIANLRFVLMIEPFISENAIIGKKLWDYIENYIKEKGIKIIRCFANEKNAKIFKKAGFYECFENHKILEKNYWLVPKE